MSQKLDVVRWTETFLDLLSRFVGARNMMLAHIVRATHIVDYSTHFALMEDICCAEDTGSLEEELSWRSLHNHPLFKDNNASVCHFLEEATRSTVCSVSMKPFQKNKDGRNAWFFIVKQCAGDGQWKRQLEKSEDYINTKVWKGNASQPLSDHVSKHRNVCVSMVR